MLIRSRHRVIIHSGNSIQCGCHLKHLSKFILHKAFKSTIIIKAELRKIIQIMLHLAHVENIVINIVSYLEDCEGLRHVQVLKNQLEVEKLSNYLSIEAGRGKCPRRI